MATTETEAMAMAAVVPDEAPLGGIDGRDPRQVYATRRRHCADQQIQLQLLPGLSPRDWQGLILTQLDDFYFHSLQQGFLHSCVTP